MPYLWSIVAAVVALIVLGALVASLLGPVRRLAAVGQAEITPLRDQVGVFTARVAALRARIAQRRDVGPTA